MKNLLNTCVTVSRSSGERRNVFQAKLKYFLTGLCDSSLLFTRADLASSPRCIFIRFLSQYITVHIAPVHSAYRINDC